MATTGKITRIDAARRAFHVAAVHVDPARALGPMEAPDNLGPILADGDRVIIERLDGDPLERAAGSWVIIGRLPASI